MNILIANRITGEVVGTNVLAGIKQLRGVIRKWMKEGLSINEFRILETDVPQLYSHIQQYAWSQSIYQCDVCKAEHKNSDLHWVEDNHGVCLVVICKECNGTL